MTDTRISPAPPEAPGPAPPTADRLRHPRVRAALLERYREARQRLGDPVQAWAEIQGDPELRRRYRRTRGSGGLVRVREDEAVELVAAAYVHTLGAYGPDRIACLSPPGAPGARFHALLGAPVLESPESTPGDDWADAAYLLLWGGEVPVTRAPDALRLARARYRGQKVVAVTPAPADGTRLADEVLHPHPGTDGALALAMGHVILREFLVDRETPFFTEHARRATDLPFLVTLEERGDGTYAPVTFLRAADLGRRGENAACRAVVLDEDTGRAAVPEPGPIRPVLSLYGREVSAGVEVLLPHFGADGRPGAVRRGVPATRLGGAGGTLVTTVFDLLLARYGVDRPGLPGHWPESYAEADTPGTPAWQEAHTSVPAAVCIRIAHEFARTAERSKGRCAILVGADIGRHLHGDTLRRAVLALLRLTGCPDPDDQDIPGAPDDDARRMDPAVYWYLHTGRRRSERSTADVLASPFGRGRLAGLTGADCLALAARTGWTAVYPAFDRNPLDLGDTFGDPVARVVADLRAGDLGVACEDPDAPENWPRVLTLGGGDALDEHGLRCLVGTASPAQAPEGVRPRDVTWREPAPEGRLDLLVSLDGTDSAAARLADVVLPTATADGEPGPARTEFETFAALAERIGALAARHLGVRKDLVATPLRHGSPDDTAPPGAVLDWRHGDCTPVPGRSLPHLTVVERNYPALGTDFAALGTPAPDDTRPRTGRRYFFLDHDWAHELGESLPVYRPPSDVRALLGPSGQPHVTVRRLTPHEQWSVHCAYPDALFLPALASGGRYLWLSPEDAGAIGVAEGDRVEAVSGDGVIVARAVVSDRMPAGTMYTRREPEATPAETPGILKPTRLLGHHGGLFTGGPGDEVTVVRRHGGEVD